MGLILALCCALLRSGQDVWIKKGLTDKDVLLVAWGSELFGAACMSLVLLVQGFPMLGPQFWKTFVMVGILNTCAALLYVRAVSKGDLSVVVPLLTFTPFFMLITTPSIIGERLDGYGYFGVFLLVIGAYVLQLSKISEGFWGPLRALFTTRGAPTMLLVAAIWSVTSPLDKIGVTNSSPVLWSFVINVFIVTALFPAMVFRWRKGVYIGTSRSLVLTGCADAASDICQMTALKFIPVTFVIALKRTSVLWTVIFAGTIFKEKEWKKRLLGSAFMAAGAILIYLSFLGG